jgi:DNA-binding CsgD family transcriptional regulator
MADRRRFRLMSAVTRGSDSYESDVHRSLQREVMARIDRLTRREREVASRLIRGLMNREVASELGTSENTVRVRRGHILAKLQVGSVAQLIRLVKRAGRAAMLKLTGTAAASGSSKSVERRHVYSASPAPKWRSTCNVNVNRRQPRAIRAGTGSGRRCN